MAEYIDAKYLFKCSTCTHCRNGRCNTYCDHFECYTPDLNLIPTADVVEVVRCKDCVYYEDKLFCICSGQTYVSVTANHFCGHGVKMDGKDGAE